MSDLSLPPPTTDQAYMDVSALEAGSLKVPLKIIISGSSPHELIRDPSPALSLRHSKTGYQVVFDSGIRSSTERLGIIEEGWCVPEDVDAVVVSHLHWDHVGDPDPFTRALFVVGEGCREVPAKGYPIVQDAIFASTALPLERTRFLAETDMNTSIGLYPFPRALGYFGDGSMYVTDTPGHLPGHVNVLARTSQDGAWIHLGGDAVHHFHILTGEEQVAYSVNAGVVRCVHVNREAAEESIRRIAKLLDVPRVQVQVAHDYDANKGGVSFFPGTISPLT